MHDPTIERFIGEIDEYDVFAEPESFYLETRSIEPSREVTQTRR